MFSCNFTRPDKQPNCVCQRTNVNTVLRMRISIRVPRIYLHLPRTETNSERISQCIHKSTVLDVATFQIIIRMNDDIESKAGIKRGRMEEEELGSRLEKEEGEETRKEMKVGLQTTTGLDLSKPENNWLIRKYLAADAKAAELVVEQEDNERVLENLDLAMQKRIYPVQLDIKVDGKDFGVLKFRPDGLLLVNSLVSATPPWSVFDELAYGYTFTLPDASENTGFKLTPGFEDVPNRPREGKDATETIRNFEEWTRRVEEHHKLSTDTAAYKFDQIALAKHRVIPALLKGFFEYMDK